MKKQYKKEAQKLSEASQLQKLKEVKQKLQIFLIVHYLKKKSYTSQYTILYKSYAIVTAFIMTLIFNFLLSDQNDSKRYGLNVWIKQQSQSDILKNLFVFIPLDGKYYIVFFQMMILTTFQIIYEGAMEVYNKLNSKDIASSSQKQKKQNATGSTQQNNASDLQEQDSFKNIISGNANQKQSNIQKQMKQLKKFSDSLGQNKEKPSIKFIYLVSVLFMEPIIWEGILIKKWRKKKIHLTFFLCCVAQYLLWVVINSTLRNQQKGALSDYSKVIFNGYYMFGIK